VVKIVVKKEGATQNCGRCGSDVICRLKDYGGNFAPTLQWQNYDGKAHYKTSDGKNYSCNIPEDEDTEQTQIETPKVESSINSNKAGMIPATNVGGVPVEIIPRIEEKIEETNIRLQKLDEMVQAIFRYTVDEQLKKKDTL